MIMSLLEVIKRLEKIKDQHGNVNVVMEGFWFSHGRNCVEFIDCEKQYKPHEGPVEVVYDDGDIQRYNSLDEARKELQYWGHGRSYIRKPEVRL